MDEDGRFELHDEFGNPRLLIETSLMFSRLAAVRGHETDIIALSNRLNLAAVIDGLEDERKAESIAWIEREADAGSEMATSALNRIAADASPRALAWARDFSVRLKRYIPRTPSGDDTSDPGPAMTTNEPTIPLDMLPPQGKSLAWLRQQVGRNDPKARLLVHDGHLHGGFNGYYRAPKLGGMAKQ